MKTREHSGAKPLISVLSIFLAFVLVCAAVIAVLVGAGVMNVDWIRGGKSPESGTSETSDNAGLSGEFHEITLEDGGMSVVLRELPFYDNFYVKIYATYVGNYGIDGTGGKYKLEAYDVYRSGDKYKILTYNNNMKLVKTLVCDGEKVVIRDETTSESAEYSASGAYSFSSVAPIPDFSVFESGKYEISSYELSDGEYILKCGLPDMKTADEIHISADTGIVTFFRTEYEGRQYYDYFVSTFDTGYVFSASDFDLSK